MKLQTTYQLITAVLTVPHILFVMTFKLRRVFLCKCERFTRPLELQMLAVVNVARPGKKNAEQLEIISNSSRSHIANQRGGGAVIHNLVRNKFQEVFVHLKTATLKLQNGKNLQL